MSSRARRALTLITLSILAITVAGIAYLHPTIGLGSALNAAPAPLDSSQIAAVDFVTPTTGWVVMEQQPHDFAVLQTTDSGDTWNQQLAGTAGAIGEYARFFDAAHGVLVVLGPHALIYQTSDGGSTWSHQSLTQGTGNIWSADFVDANHGWLLAQDPTVGEELLRTQDGGATWVGLGEPVLPQDWAYSVAFVDPNVGWLYSQSAGPYAYKSLDGGTTWRRMALPAQPGGSAPTVVAATSGEKFFVAPHPTQGLGVMTTVIGAAPTGGRLADGRVVLGYPPLSVSTYGGIGSVTYIYAAVIPYRYSSIEYVDPGPLVDTEPADQFQLSSVDGGVTWKTIVPPSTYGAVGFVDALNWWWIGSGASSTSSDAGRSWTQVRGMGVVEPLPGTLQFIDANHGWFGGMAGTRPLVETTDDGGINWKMFLLPAITAP
jgi:photosystem II stability/assembly factor-like uncharacterized protein